MSTDFSNGDVVKRKSGSTIGRICKIDTEFGMAYVMFGYASGPRCLYVPLSSLVKTDGNPPPCSSNCSNGLL